MGIEEKESPVTLCAGRLAWSMQCNGKKQEEAGLKQGGRQEIPKTVLGPLSACAHAYPL